MEKLHTFCSSPNIVRVIKARRMKWTKHVVCTEERDVANSAGETGRKEITWKT
jgi:hypothetical protein